MVVMNYGKINSWPTLSHAEQLFYAPNITGIEPYTEAHHQP